MRDRLGEIAKVFTKLGFTAFGGPAAHIAMIEDEVVTRRGWLDRTHFLDIVAAVNFVPGPNSTELAIHLGQIRGLTGGIVGAITATIAIFLPSFLFVAILGPMLQRIRQNRYARSALDAMNAAVVALILIVLIDLGIAAVNDWLRMALAGVSLLILLGRKLNATWIIVASGLIGWVVSWLR